MRPPLTFAFRPRPSPSQEIPQDNCNKHRRGRHPDKALSAAFCRTVAESGRYADGNGLHLHVDPSGARRWVQRLVIRGRSRGLGLGSYTLVSLAEARELALANRKLARAGGDPLAAKRRTEGKPFEEAAEKVTAIHSGAWKDGGKSAKQRRASLSEYAYRRIGDKGVDQVATADVMAVVLPIWTSKHETAQRVRWRISAIMKWAIAQGYRSDKPGRRGHRGGAAGAPREGPSHAGAAVSRGLRRDRGRPRLGRMERGEAGADERPVIFATGVGGRGVLAGDDGAAATDAPAPSTRRA